MKLHKHFPYGAPISIPSTIRLAEAIEELEPYVSIDETRYFVNGIYFIPFTTAGLTPVEMIRMVATDGWRLSLKEIPIDWFPESFHPNGIYATVCNPVSITFYPIEGQFPNYERVIPNTEKLPHTALTIIDSKKADFIPNNSQAICRFILWSKHAFNLSFFTAFPAGEYTCYGDTEQNGAFVFNSARIKIVIMPMSME